MENYYKILGIPERSDEEEIKRAYRKLAFKYHPDRNPDDKLAEDKFKKLTEAYRILSDSKKRAEYDRAQTFATGHPNSRTVYQSPSSHVDEVFDLFENFSTPRSTSRKKTQPMPGADIKSNLTISFEESILGTTATLDLTRLEQCLRCQGTGIEPKNYPMLCPTCLGKGRIRQSHGFLGFMQICQDCNGSGRVYQRECSQCRGSSRIPQTRRISVAIPPNIREGAELKVAGEGESGLYGGKSGDLFITVHIRKHERFERKENDIWYELSLSISQAILGAVVEVPTLDGKSRIRIPPGTQSDRVFRLSKKGAMISPQSAERGDFLIRVKVKIPSNLPPPQRELIEAFARLNGETIESSSPVPYPATKKLSSWFQKLIGKKPAAEDE